MRLATRLALVLSLGVCGVTHAGSIVHDPFGEAFTICGETAVATNTMDPPAGFFSSFSDCKALCSKAEGVCKKLQKDNSSCYFDVIKNEELWSKRDCKAVYSAPADVKQCQQGAKDFYGPVLDGYRNDLKSALDQCRVWGDTCRNTCELG